MAVPLLVMVLTTLWAGLALSVKVSSTVLPLSALTLTTPVAALASAAVAPSLTPVPSVTSGVAMLVSSAKLASPAALLLPAASVAVA